MQPQKRVLLNLVVSGRVQGVGFRYFTLRRARELDITGWVRNRYDGKVEIEAEGTREGLERFLAEIQKGPPASRVTHIAEDWMDITASMHSSFEVTG